MGGNVDRSDDWRGAVVGDSWTEPDCGERVPSPVKNAADDDEFTSE